MKSSRDLAMRARWEAFGAREPRLREFVNGVASSARGTFTLRELRAVMWPDADDDTAHAYFMAEMFPDIDDLLAEGYTLQQLAEALRSFLYPFDAESWRQSLRQVQ